jgi:hypothetical protein
MLKLFDNFWANISAATVLNPEGLTSDSCMVLT